MENRGIYKTRYTGPSKFFKTAFYKSTSFGTTQKRPPMLVQRPMYDISHLLNTQIGSAAALFCVCIIPGPVYSAKDKDKKTQSDLHIYTSSISSGLRPQVPRVSHAGMHTGKQTFVGYVYLWFPFSSLPHIRCSNPSLHAYLSRKREKHDAGNRRDKTGRKIPKDGK